MGSPLERPLLSEEEALEHLSNAHEAKAPALTKKDRCDQCGAQAFVRARRTIFYPPPGGRVAQFIPGDLLFCGHHYARHEAALAQNGWGIDDHRHLINSKPSPSANVDPTPSENERRRQR